MTDSSSLSTPWFLWPFALILRLVAAVVGLALMIAGGVLCMLIITLPIGIPLATFGFMLMLKGFK